MKLRKWKKNSSICTQEIWDYQKIKYIFQHTFIVIFFTVFKIVLSSSFIEPKKSLAIFDNIFYTIYRVDVSHSSNRGEHDTWISGVCLNLPSTLFNMEKKKRSPNIC